MDNIYGVFLKLARLYLHQELRKFRLLLGGPLFI